MRRFLPIILFLLPLNLYAQGASTPAFRGQVLFPLTFTPDNTYDIGAVAASRPRTGYFGTSLFTPALTVSGLTATRCTFAGTGGLLSDDSDCTFDGTTLSATQISSGNGLVGAVGYRFASGGATFGWYWSSGVGWVYSDGGNPFFAMHTSVGPTIRADRSLVWGSSGISSGDVSIAREGASILSIRNNSTSRRGFIGGGPNVASATALPVPVAALYHVTGTTTITSITSTNMGTGVCITLIFDGALTLTDGSNLKMAGDFVTTADDTWTGCYDGSNWYETGRTVN